MKKRYLTYGKKTLSVLMAVLMLMTAWVFVPGEHQLEAEAATTDTTHRVNTDKYGTPYWTPTDSNTRWMLWGVSTSANDAHAYIKVPKTIYIDVGETLQSAGYKIVLDWSWGNSTDYRWGLGPAAWGKGSGINGQSGSEQFTMENMFESYTAEASNHGSTEYGGAGNPTASNADLRQHDNYSGSTGFFVFKNTGSTKNWANNIYLVGTPSAVGTGRYSTSGINPSPFNFAQKWSWGSWSNSTSPWNNNGKPDSVSEQLYGYNEVWWDVVIYDKAPLKTAVDKSNTAYNSNYMYSAYVLDNGLSKLATLSNEGGSLLSIREITIDTIENKTNAINAAIIALSFQAKNADLIAKVNEAKALQAKPGYSTLYTEASRNALQAAIDTATANSLYTTVPVYSYTDQSTTPGAKADADQTTINNLISGINTAINGLARKYDVGYDNLFSFTDWAASNAVNINRGTATVDVDGQKFSTTSWDKATADAWVAEASGRTEAQALDCYTSYGLSSSYSTMKVKGNTSYTLKFNATDNGQCYVFFYTDSGAASTAHQSLGASNGSNVKTFTTPSDCTGIQLRFGSTGAYSKTITFSNIGVYETSVYNDYANNYSEYREIFTAGEAKALDYAPVREGYAFDGWYNAAGTKLTTTSGLSASDIVYAHWIQQHTVTFKNYDGTVIKTEKVTPGNSATAPLAFRDADDDYEYDFSGWDVAFTNVQSDLTVTAQYTPKAHSGIKITNGSVAPDCETAGTYKKLCTVCNHQWNNGNEITYTNETGAEYQKYAPTGHSYTDVLRGSSDGNVDGYHTTYCENQGCIYGADGGPASIQEKHTFGDTPVGSSDATCVIPGETYYQCDCLQQKTVYGDVNPNKHVNTALEGVVAATCTADGYTGDTVCKDCGVTTKKGAVDPMIPHKFTTYVSDGNATCTADGTKTAKCDYNCGTEETVTDTGSMIPHKFTNYVSNGDATCTADGTKTAKCDYNCGKTETVTDIGSMLPHDYDETTYISKGNGTHVFACKKCGAESVAESCTYGEWTKDDADTHSHTCKFCSYTPAAEAHKFSDWKEASDNTDAAAGKMTRECSVCHRVEETVCDYEVTVHKDATCTSPETTTYTCKECGHGYTEIGKAATGHDYTGAVKSYADGNHNFLCKNGCNTYGFDGTENAMTACTYKYESTADGKHNAICEVCGYTKSEDCTGGTATCTAKAVCAKCKAEYGKLADHSYTGSDKYLYKATEATCIANETYYYYCVGCEQTTDGVGTYEKPDTMTPHDFTCTDEYLYIATQAECGVNETYYAYCSNPDCKKSSEDAANTYVKEGTALEHSWVNPVNNGDGTHTLSCENTNTDGWSCTETITLNCADSAINFGYEPSTCTEQGYTTYQCTACGYTWNADYEAPLGHDYTEKLYNEAHLKEDANCEHGKIYWYDCSRCDENAKDETDTDKYTTLTFENGKAREHDWTDVVDAKYLASEATCTAAAKYYKSCSYADCAKSAQGITDEKFSYGQALGHDWVHPADEDLEEYLATPADCITDATYYFVCSRADACGMTTSKGSGKTDGETWTDVGSADGHNLTHKEAVAATCYAAGNYEYWYCSTCKKYFKDEDATEAYLNEAATVIKKREHDIVDVAFKKATCEEDGHPAYEYCKYEDCDYTTLPADISAYAKTGHNFTGAWTCDTVHNYHSQLCLNGCGESGLVVDGEQVKYTVEYDGLDYTYAGGEKCDFTGAFIGYTDENGIHSHQIDCKCGNVTTVAIGDTFVKTVAPDCENDGYDLHKCEPCGETWKKNIVTTSGHDWADKATSNGDGTHSVKCSKCDEEKEVAKCSGGTATCKDQAKCEVCEAPYGETGEHTFTTDWVYQNDAKCGVNGTEKNTCSVCNTEVSREAAGTALEHDMSAFGYTLPEGWDAPDFDETTVKAPNCKDEGLSISYCKREGCTYYETALVEADKTMHIWSTNDEWTADEETGEKVWENIGGNCADGITLQKKCSVCGDKETKTIEGEHNYVETLFIEPLCNKGGYKQEKCTVCSFVNEITYDEKDESTHFLAPTGDAGHKFGPYIEYPATCTNDSYSKAICEHCKKEDIKVNAGTMLPHDYKTVSAKAATCDEAGYSSYSKCLDCGYISGKTDIPALGHKDNGEGRCDECNKVLYETGDGDSKGCGCICHKTNFIMRIIYKILNFFWKLFKISKSCACGAVHW